MSLAIVTAAPQAAVAVARVLLDKSVACQLSIIIPTLNEAQNIVSILLSLQPLREQGCEIIVVDGGSSDGTTEKSLQLSDRVLNSQPGRAIQQNEGAHYARHDILLFLHADTRLPVNAAELICKAMSREDRKVWGRFNVRLSGSRFMFRIIETLMNLRSCLTGIATGDQAIFVKRAAWDKVGGMPPQALMEDIALSSRLLALSRPVCLEQTVTTSSRRWEEKGIFRTILLMWWLRLRYFFGADPDVLVRRYYS